MRWRITTSTYEINVLCILNAFHVIFANVDDFLTNFPDTREREMNIIDQRIAKCIHRELEEKFIEMVIHWL